MVQWETVSEKRSQQYDPFRKDKLSGEEPDWEPLQTAEMQSSLRFPASKESGTQLFSTTGP
jgi:hypothetical protein